MRIWALNSNADAIQISPVASHTFYSFTAYLFFFAKPGFSDKKNLLMELIKII